MSLELAANATLATEADAHRVVESVTTAGGNRTVTQTGYDSAGDVVFVTTSAAGTSIPSHNYGEGDGMMENRFRNGTPQHAYIPPYPHSNATGVR